MTDRVVSVGDDLTLPEAVIVPAARIPDLASAAVTSVNGQAGAVAVTAAGLGDLDTATAALVGGDGATASQLSSTYGPGGTEGNIGYAQAGSVYAKKSLLRASIRQTQIDAIPDVPVSPPSIAWSSIEPTGKTRIGWSDARLTKSGLIPSAEALTSFAGHQALIDSNGGVHSHYYETDYDGQSLSVGFVSRSTGSSWAYWLFVDGSPVTAVPGEISGADATSTAQATFLTIAFTSRGTHRIRLWVARASVTGFYISPTESLSSTPAPIVKAALIGDSFIGSQELGGMVVPLAQLLNWDIYNCAQGGTGYANAGSTGPSNSVFGSSARLAWLTAINPDIVIVVGSVNDDAFSATVGAAASALYQWVATNLPGTPIVVVGPQNTSASTTWTTSRVANDLAVAGAAAAAANVLGYESTLNVGAVPTAWAVSTAYNPNDVVLSKGAAYKCLVAHTSAGSASFAPDNIPGRWSLVSWYTGTGWAGAPAGDGNRDVYLSSDGTHPTLATASVWGARYWATRIANAVQKYLQI